MSPDFTLTAADYLRHRRPFPKELFGRLRRFGLGAPGQTILDIGAGTGSFSDPLSSNGCRVICGDVSEALLSTGRSNPAVVARAESLPFASDQFDAVTAAQCWHWFDRRVAPAEIHRVLRRDGVLVVAYQMHVPLPGSVAEATEKLILRFRPAWRHANSAGINGQVLRDMQAHRFSGIESFSFDVAESYSHEDWRGFIRTTSAVGPSMPDEMLARFDLDHAAMLVDWPEPLQIPHRIFAAISYKSGQH